MSVEPPDQDRRNRPPITYLPIHRAPPYRPGTLWSAIVNYGIAHGMIPASAAPAAVAPTMPLSTTHAVVISMSPKPAPAPVEAAPPAAAATAHVAPHGAGMGVYPV